MQNQAGQNFPSRAETEMEVSIDLFLKDTTSRTRELFSIRFFNWTWRLEKICSLEFGEHGHTCEYVIVILMQNLMARIWSCSFCAYQPGW